MKKQTGYVTSDGRFFTDKCLAAKHQLMVTLRSDIDDTIEDLTMNCIVSDALKDAIANFIVEKSHRISAVITEYHNNCILEINAADNEAL